jgi:hypothetical protein
MKTLNFKLKIILSLILFAVFFLAAPQQARAATVALTGTITTSVERDVINGSKTIILTVTGDTWVTAGATFDAQRQNIINGIDSGGSEATGWDAVVKAGLAVTAVVRTSSTVVTITLPAFASYKITAPETITSTVPSTALAGGGGAVVASPTFTLNPSDRYWVGGTGNWSSTSHWAYTSGGSSGVAVPTSLDNVYFNTSSSTSNAAYTATIDATANCRAFTMDGPDPADGTKVTWAGSSDLNAYADFNLSGGTAGITRSYTGGISLLGIASGSYTFTSNGVSFGGTVYFNSTYTDFTWSLADALVTAGYLYVGGGTFNTNNNAITAGLMQNGNGAAKTLNLGTSTITLTGTSSYVWRFGSGGTLPTMDADQTTIITTAAAGSIGTFEAGNYTYGTITCTLNSFTTTGATIATLNLTGTTQTLTGSNTITTLTRTSTSAKTDTLTLGGDQVVGTLNLNGYSSTSRLLVQSNVKGTARAIIATTVSASYVDFQDIRGIDSATAVQVQIPSDADDTYRTSTGSWGNSSATDLFGYYSSYYRSVSGRWTGVTIPAASTIRTAYVSFNTRSTSGALVKVAISFEKALAPTQISSNADWLSRAKTAQTVSWTLADDSAGAWSSSPELKDIIQELVNSYDYSGGSSMQALVEDLTSTSTAAKAINTYANGSTLGAKLVISYGGWDLSAITGGSGDCGGNTGITFTASDTWYWSSGAGSWSDTTKWFTDTGGTGTRLDADARGAYVVLPQDDVVFDAASFSSGSTVTVDMPRVGKNVDMTNVDAGASLSGSLYYSIYGNLTIGSSMASSAFSGGNGIIFEGRGNQTITSNGKTIGRGVTITAVNGSYTLQDDLTAGAAQSFTITSGTFDANNKNVTAGYGIRSSNSNVRTVTMGSGNWTVTGCDWSSSGWDLSTNTNLTFNKGTGTIKFTGSSASACPFKGGGLTYNNFWDSLTSGAVTITGSNTFNDFKIDAGKTVNFTAGTNTTVNTFTALGTSGSHIVIGSVTAATHTLTKAGGGLILGDYLDITYSTASPANTWYATNSTADGNTTGWILTAIPGSTYKTLVGKGVDSYQVMTDSANVYGYNNVTSVASTPLSSGAWHHVVMTYDGANQKIYIDGVLQTTNPATGVIRTNSSNLEIGQGFAGKIDDVKIYNRAISQQEVTAAYGGYNAGVVVSDLQKGLVGQWKMNGNTKDSTPNANDGTNSGAVLAPDRKGTANSAYSFNGTSDYMNMGDVLDMGTNDWTASVWFKTTDADYSLIAKSHYSGADNRWYIARDATGLLACFDTAAVSNCTSPGYTADNDGNWHQAVGVWDRDGNLTLYVDGVSRGVLNISAANGTNVQSSFYLFLGRYNDGSTGQLPHASALIFNGSMDDVRVYNRALSSAEITALYQEYDPGIVVSDLQKGLVGQWKMDGNVKDNTPYENNGTNNGAVLAPDRKGQANKSYNFDGTSNHISAGDVGTVKTVSFWMQADVTASKKVIDIDGTKQIELDGSSNVVATSFPAATIYLDGLSTSANIPDTNWHFVTITDTTGVSASTFDVGAVSTSYFDGKIDDVRVYNRALSPTEIRALYESY